jgi:hypothetical protein
LAPRFIPTHWRLRCLGLFFVSWIVITLCVSLGIMVPIALGRLFSTLLLIPIQYRHDPLHYILGMKLCIYAFAKHTIIIDAYFALYASCMRVKKYINKSTNDFIIKWIFIFTFFFPVGIGCTLRCIGNILEYTKYLPTIPVLSVLLSGNVSQCGNNGVCMNNLIVDDIVTEVWELPQNFSSIVWWIIQDWAMGIAACVVTLMLADAMGWRHITLYVWRDRSTTTTASDDSNTSANSTHATNGANVDINTGDGERDGGDDNNDGTLSESDSDENRNQSGNQNPRGEMVEISLVDLVNELAEHADMVGVDAPILIADQVNRIHTAVVKFYEAFVPPVIGWASTLLIRTILCITRAPAHKPDFLFFAKMMMNSIVLGCSLLAIHNVYSDKIKTYANNTINALRDEVYLRGKRLECSEEGQKKLNELRATTTTTTDDVDVDIGKDMNTDVEVSDEIFVGVD